LGDGCYATFDGIGIWLTTENGVEVTNEVYLEPIALAALVQFAREHRQKGRVTYRGHSFLSLAGYKAFSDDAEQVIVFFFEQVSEKF
jgi:hypothetical protein